ncbi:MAG: hypothetical protein RSA84_11320 [Acinetobacter sp.]
MHTTRNGKSARDELPLRSSEWREFITATVKAAHPFTDAASANLNLHQDGSPEGGDGLPAPFTTAVSRQGRCPILYLLFLSQRMNTQRDKQRDAERDRTYQNK